MKYTHHRRELLSREALPSLKPKEYNFFIREEFSRKSQTIPHSREAVYEPIKTSLVISSAQNQFFPTLAHQLRSRAKQYSQIQQKLARNNFIELKPQPIIQQNFTNRISAKRWCVHVKKKNKPKDGFIRVLGLNDDKKCEMASITKIMTFYTCLLYFEEYKLNAKIINVKIPAIAQEIEGTSAFLFKGDVLSIYDLYYGLMLPSGNDAATVLSLSVGLMMLWKMKKPKLWERMKKKGGIIDFDQEKDVEKKELTILYLKHMNTNAERIGMRNTKFTSVHGLSDQYNISTCQDLLQEYEQQLSERCLYYQQFKEVVNCKQYSVKNYYWKNTNKLLKLGWEGIKTGTTNNAGPCFCGYWQNEDVEILVIVLKCQSLEARWFDTEQILKLCLSY